MKNFLLFAVAAIMGITPVSADAPKEQETKTGAIVLIMRDKCAKDTRNRSAIGTPVSAYLDLDMGQIEVAFDIPEGTATTTIVNAFGQAICQYTCNSEIEWLIYLPLPTEAGDYKLKIVTAEAEYEGSFTL
ncbi:MAG: hypothetical protein NC209_05905 [Alistipes sp.]|nr:hypothetical protein [Alistipes senegalensis]MCM1250658.1 hypothetical protein [Alistipes sp.]